MKAITLYQPWATLVAINAKKIETRSWKTNYRGILAIHASRKLPTNIKRICFEEPFKQVLSKFGYIQLFGDEFSIPFPLGSVIATCQLVSCERIDPELLESAQSSCGWWRSGCFWPFNWQEKEFGDYTVGRYAWLLTNIKMLSEPIKVKGMLGIWEWDENNGN